MQQPIPFHPQRLYGSGVQTGAEAYPNLAAYYGPDFRATFTTLDLLDSHEARLNLVEAHLEEMKLILADSCEPVEKRKPGLLQRFRRWVSQL